MICVGVCVRCRRCGLTSRRGAHPLLEYGRSGSACVSSVSISLIPTASAKHNRPNRTSGASILGSTVPQNPCSGNTHGFVIVTPTIGLGGLQPLAVPRMQCYCRRLTKSVNTLTVSKENTSQLRWPDADIKGIRII